MARDEPGAHDDQQQDHPYADQRARIELVGCRRPGCQASNRAFGPIILIVDEFWWWRAHDAAFFLLEGTSRGGLTDRLGRRYLGTLFSLFVFGFNELGSRKFLGSLLRFTLTSLLFFGFSLFGPLSTLFSFPELSLFGRRKLGGRRGFCFCWRL